MGRRRCHTLLPPPSLTQASGYYDGGKPVPLGRKTFPPLSAGALGSAAALADWLRHLCLAYHRPQGSGAISHAAARAMLTPSAKGDLGSEAFMSAAMGVGMFVFDAVPTSTTKPAGGGPAAASRWMLHQAANDGFRGVLLICFDGPDARDGPRGVVVLANGGRAFCGPAFPPTGIDPSNPQSPEELYASAWPSTALSPIYDPLLRIVTTCRSRQGRHRPSASPGSDSFLPPWYHHAMLHATRPPSALPNAPGT